MPTTPKQRLTWAQLAEKAARQCGKLTREYSLAKAVLALLGDLIDSRDRYRRMRREYLNATQDAAEAIYKAKDLQDELELVRAERDIARTQIAESQAREQEIRDAAEFVRKAFSDTEAAGYRSRDRQFCIAILDEAFAEQSDMSALQSAIAEAVAPYKRDAERMDWLEQMTVNVRTPLRYGSEDLFWASPEDDDGEPLPSKIRSKIDAAISAKEKSNG